MKEQVNPLELIGFESLDFDLFDGNNKKIYHNGTSLTPDFLMKLNFKKIYKNITNSTADDFEPEFESLISQTATEELIKNTRKIIQRTYDGKSPDTSICERARDTIVEEVGEKLEKIECIGQLRVYDEYTFSHTVNVSSMCSALAFQLGYSEKDIKDLALGALLHDIGKMRIPKQVLNKPGPLDDDEFQLIKSHTIHGYNIIKQEMNLPERIARVALEHQEKFGGGGYPNRLKQNEISAFAQIAAIADVYDALVSKRVYKNPIPSSKAIKIMMEEGSKAFNPRMLYKFIYLANNKDSSNINPEELLEDI
ncbi:MAG: HD-GYP domain-containing protein [Candidatus Gastranaerophilales bacterium]|nr:HD-GYP domain-containing protein [Candidatus Gastranaerophilales bacterium]